MRVDRKHYQLHAKERYTNPDLFFHNHIRHLNDSLNHGDTLLLLQDVSEKLTSLRSSALIQAHIQMTYLLIVWGVDSWLGEDTIKDETDGNTTWDTDKSSLFVSTFIC